MPYREKGAISCVANEELDSGVRVKLVATPAGDTLGLPYVEAETAATGAFIGVTNSAAEAGDIVSIIPIYMDFVKVRVDVVAATTLYTGSTIYTGNPGNFTTANGTGQIPCGVVVSPLMNVTGGASVTAEAMVFLYRWIFDEES